MSTKFATLALLGACANAQWSDLSNYAAYHEPKVPHYPRVEPRDHPMMPESSEARYLAVLLGMDEDRIYPNYSNSLDELVEASQYKEHQEDDQTSQFRDSETSVSESSLSSSSSETSELENEYEHSEAESSPILPIQHSFDDRKGLIGESIIDNEASNGTSSESEERVSSSSSSSSSSSDTDDEFFEDPNLTIPRKPAMKPQYEYIQRDEDGSTFQEPQPQIQKSYDIQKFSQSDLDAIQRIVERSAPPKKEATIEKEGAESLKKDDDIPLEQQLDVAEQYLQERLRKNLEMYHDLQKLKQKPQSEFTTQDLLFVKQSVCSDGTCFKGAFDALSPAAVMASLCSLAVFLF